MFKKLICSISMFAMVAGSTWAAPAVTTANLNFRAGPGSSFGSMGVIPDGTQVEILDCNDSGSWCGIQHAGEEGFVSGKYLNLLEAEEDLAWPRAFGLEGDAFVVLHQPQFTAWDGVSKIEALVAAEYRASEDATAVFGVVGLSAAAQRDDAEGTIILTDARIASLDFAALDRDSLQAVSLGLNGLLPTGPVTMSEERVLASLASIAQAENVEGLNSEPPVIFVSQTPAILVMTDGPAVFAPIAGVSGLEFVLNTNWDVFRLNDVYYLRVEEAWLSLTEPDAGWQPVADLPAEFATLPKDGNWDAVRAAIPAKPFEGNPPEVFYSEEPAEMVLFDGAPVLEDVPGTDLEWAANTESDLFRHKSTGAWYYLVSGRWFRTYSREGPFEFATNDLPTDFQFLPDDKPYYTVRASVPGTSEANEARLRAMIPETARVDLGSVSPDVAYDGDPDFAPIEGTDLAYAVNTPAQVIQVGDKYYAVQDGVWFVGDSPGGPWEVATDIPPAIYEIPPSSPVHNVTYVRVYEKDDNSALFGFTMGYLFAYLAWDTLVYGSGWYYPPYWGHHRYPIYYPRPLSYGSGAYYNPARGTYGRYGYAYGPYRGIEARAAWNPATGTYMRGARAYGPYGQRGFVSAYNPRTNTRAVARGGSNVYGRWGSASVRRGSEYANIRARENNAGGQGVRWDSSKGNGFALSDRRGNVYAGRDGNVYRRVGDDWQKWGNGGWNGVQPPATGSLRRNENTGTTPLRSRTQPVGDRTLRVAPVNRTSPTLRSTTRTPVTTIPTVRTPVTRVPSNVQRDVRTREIGNQRTVRRNTAPPRRTTTATISRPQVTTPNRTNGVSGRPAGLLRR